MYVLFLEAEETVCSGDIEEDTTFKMKQSAKKKRSLDAVSPRTKRQKCSEEVVTSDSEEFDNELVPSDQTDEIGELKETTDSDDNTEGTYVC